MVIRYMEKSGEINKNCHAYRKLLGTMMAMLEVNDNIYSIADEHKIATTMTINQSSIFDCRQHDILDEKLKLYKFSDKTRRWFSSYLSHQSQFVTINTKDSIIKPMGQGPPVSILGPLIFVIYLNELPNLVKDGENCRNLRHSANKDNLFGENCPECGRIVCYLDDSTYITVSRTRTENQEKLERNLGKIAEFLTSNGMAINPIRTNIGELMVKQKWSRLAGSSPSLATRQPNGQVKTIECSRFIRLLGGNLQDDQTWRGHLELSNKCLLPALRGHPDLLLGSGSQRGAYI